MSSERMSILRSEYDERVKRVQAAMQEKDIDIYIVHGCECEGANVRYLTDFWAVFDFAGVIIPREGNPIFLTGGPESYDFAKQFAKIDDVRVHPLYVETSAPEWDKPTNVYDYNIIFDEISKRFEIKKIAIGNTNTIPYQIMQDIIKGAKKAKIVFDDDLIMKLRWQKSSNEIELLKEAFRITDEAAKFAIEMVRPGVREWEIEAAWRSKIYTMGAEGTGYPVWVTSGPKMYQSLCKSSERVIEQNDVVQLTFGAKYQGYCGNMCRPVIVGKTDQKREAMIRTALDCLNETKQNMKPGVPFAKVYDDFQARLERDGYSGQNLYGPAHGTGLQECEGPWVDNRTDMILKPGMVFNIDIWIADDEFGVRFEDGVIVTETGLECLTAIPDEAIRR